MAKTIFTGQQHLATSISIEEESFASEIQLNTTMNQGDDYSSIFLPAQFSLVNGKSHLEWAQSV